MLALHLGSVLKSEPGPCTRRTGQKTKKNTDGSWLVGGTLTSKEHTFKAYLGLQRRAGLLTGLQSLSGLHRGLNGPQL